jgi:membrane-bound metal-dependent hydrolase YbcI (DUF457 family)
MFIGHFAVGLAAKRAAPKTSLGLLIAAPILADLLWPTFLLLGWEHVGINPDGPPFLKLDFLAYPYSHSLLMNCLWAALFAGGYYAVTRYRAGAIVIALGVVSHWVLDVVVHVPDMPISPWSETRVGLGLWHSVPGTVAVEIVMFAIGVYLYATTTRGRDAVGRYAVWAMVALLFLFYVVSVNAAPPPTAQAIGIGALVFGLLFPVWAWWGDRHRDVVTT